MVLVIRITLIAALWVVGGCSAASSSNGPLIPASDQPTQESPVPGAGELNLPASVVDPVVADVARLAGVPIDQVVVVSAGEVTFPDGSLGCPQPGTVCTPAMVDGYQSVAEARHQCHD